MGSFHYLECRTAPSPAAIRRKTSATPQRQVSQGRRWPLQLQALRRESRQAYAQLLSMGQQCALVLIEKAFLNFEANAALVLGTIDALSSCGDFQQVANRQAEFVHQMGKQWSEQMEDYSEIFSIIITDIANATKAAAEKSSLRTDL